MSTVVRTGMCCHTDGCLIYSYLSMGLMIPGLIRFRPGRVRDRTQDLSHARYVLSHLIYLLGLSLIGLNGSELPVPGRLKIYPEEAWHKAQNQFR